MAVVGPAEDFVDKKTVAAHIKMTTRTVEHWQRRGLPHYKMGARRTRYKLSEVDAYVAERFQAA